MVQRAVAAADIAGRRGNRLMHIVQCFMGGRQKIQFTGFLSIAHLVFLHRQLTGQSRGQRAACAMGVFANQSLVLKHLKARWLGQQIIDHALLAVTALNQSRMGALIHDCVGGALHIVKGFNIAARHQTGFG